MRASVCAGVGNTAALSLSRRPTAVDRRRWSPPALQTSNTRGASIHSPKPPIYSASKTAQPGGARPEGLHPRRPTSCHEECAEQWSVTSIFWGWNFKMADYTSVTWLLHQFNSLGCFIGDQKFLNPGCFNLLNYLINNKLV